MRTEVSALQFDSRQVRPDAVFFAVDGMQTDGHQFIPQALINGAAAVISELPAPDDFPRVWAQVPRIRRCMAEMANHYYNHPSSRMRLVGVTGTNGKTTTAYLTHSILSGNGPSALVGTIETLLGPKRLPAGRTTPEATEVQQLLCQAIREGCGSGVVEVSSHALALERTYECAFEVGVFTNLSQDHLDFHGTIEDYLKAKQRLFDLSYNPGLRVAVLNGDDPFSDRLQIPSSVTRVRFGLDQANDVYPLHLDAGVDGVTMSLQLGGESLELRSPLVGQHNVYNIMSAVTACHGLGVSRDRIAAGIAALESVPGRFERVGGNAPFSIFVDYAHTPDGLENALRLARQLTAGRVICLFGCGGDRDKTKRPLMGSVAARLADYVILTSDNPRSEPPRQILDQIELGIPEGDSYQVIVDRRAAIEESLGMAEPGDLVLIAGRGHETCQEFADHQVEFDDVVVAREVHDRNFPG